MRLIDDFLNKITMYRLVLYGLVVLSAVSIIFGFFGLVSYSGISQIISLLAILIACYISNFILAYIFKVQTNVESVWISSYILFLVLTPVSSPTEVVTLMLYGFVAMSSKYILAISKKHIFNPVAISLFVLGLFGFGAGSWWIGNVYMTAFVLIFGFLVIKKVIRFDLFTSFLFSAIISLLFFGYIDELNLSDVVVVNFLSGPILFFGMIMLTEPLTTPPAKIQRVVYGMIAGLLYGAEFEFGVVYSTPELALVLANIYSYIVSPKQRLMLMLVEKKKLSEDVYEFLWNSPKRFYFKAGQYLEWTLGHRYPDNRGNRRYFTLSSSPTEENISIGIKFYDNPSSFKEKMVSMKEGERISASGLAGEFILPDDKSKKLVFIAGGIGVTPFRSILKYMVDSQEKRDVVMFFANKTSKDIVYKDVFDEAVAKDILKIYYVCGTKLPNDSNPQIKFGIVDENMIKADVPDYIERNFYISGPHGMVSAFQKSLSKLGVPKRNIKVDFFPGYA